MPYVLKIKCENSLRRITIKKTPLHIEEELSYAHLEAQIRKLFHLPATVELAMTYIDEEKDAITMTDDHDLKDALVEQALNPLRLHVNFKTSSPSINNDNGKSVKDGDIGVHEWLKGRLRELASASESGKKALQFYEPFLENMVPGLVETTLETITSQLLKYAVENGTFVPSNSAASDFAPGPPKPQLPNFGTIPSEGAHGESNVHSCHNATRIHHGVTCDICGVSPILGLRWKSNTTFDYDLCSACFENHGNEREYSAIEQPKFDPGPFHADRPARMGHPPLHIGGHCPPPRFKHFGARGSRRGYIVRLGAKRHHCGRGYGARLDARRHRCSAMMGAACEGGKGKLDARFVHDVTMFVGTEVAPGAHVTKIWRLRNSGSIPWPAHISLEHVGGKELSHVSIVPLEIPEDGLAPEAEMEASVNLIAPEKPGRYISYWRLTSAAGHQFGQRLSVLVQVIPKEALDQPAESMTVGEHAAPAQQPEPVAKITLDPATVESAEGREFHELQLESTTVPAAIVDDSSNIQGEAGAETAVNNYNKGARTDQLPHRGLPSAPGTNPFGGGVSSMIGGTFGNAASNATKEPTPIKVARADLQTEASEEDVTAISFAAPEDSGEFPYMLNLFKFGTKSEEKVEAPTISDQALEVMVRDEGPITYPMVNQAAEFGVVEPAEGEVLSTPKALLGKLDAMGFTDSKLNSELLESNGLDINKTLDNLCAVKEWHPILCELEEMGFYNTDMNLRLMFKNNGRLMEVIEELV